MERKTGGTVDYSKWKAARKTVSRTSSANLAEETQVKLTLTASRSASDSNLDDTKPDLKRKYDVDAIRLSNETSVPQKKKVVQTSSSTLNNAGITNGTLRNLPRRTRDIRDSKSLSPEGDGISREMNSTTVSPLRDKMSALSMNSSLTQDTILATTDTVAPPIPPSETPIIIMPEIRPLRYSEDLLPPAAASGLPFLPRNIHICFEHRFKPQPVHVNKVKNIAFVYSFDDRPGTQDIASSQRAWQFHRILLDWICPFCSFFPTFSTKSRFELHLSWDHPDILVEYQRLDANENKQDRWKVKFSSRKGAARSQGSPESSKFVSRTEDVPRKKANRIFVAPNDLNASPDYFVGSETTSNTPMVTVKYKSRGHLEERHDGPILDKEIPTQNLGVITQHHTTTIGRKSSPPREIIDVDLISDSEIQTSSLMPATSPPLRNRRIKPRRSSRISSQVLPNYRECDLDDEDMLNILSSPTTSITYIPSSPEAEGTPEIEEIVHHRPVPSPPRPLPPAVPSSSAHSSLSTSPLPLLPPDTLSFRPGGPFLYDLLPAPWEDSDEDCTTVPRKDGLLAESQEEEIFEMVAVREDDKVMAALWSRWMITHRDIFLADRKLGTMHFIEENYKIINRAVGRGALTTFFLVLVSHRFIDSAHVASLLREYSRLTEASEKK